MTNWDKLKAWAAENGIPVNKEQLMNFFSVDSELEELKDLSKAKRYLNKEKVDKLQPNLFGREAK